MSDSIDRLTIKGFKSIRSLEDFELRRINILIGANGAGKSNFVSFFSLLRALVQQELQLAVSKAGGADMFLFLGRKETKRIEAKLHFGVNGYEFDLEPTADNRVVFSSEFVTFRGDHTNHRDLLGKGHLEAKLKDKKDSPGYATGAQKGVPYYVYNAVSDWTAYHFHDTSDTAAVRRVGSARDYERLRVDASNLAAFLLRIRESRPQRYELIRDTVRLVAPFFDDFTLRPQTSGPDSTVQLEWTQRGSDYPFHPSQLSDGTLRFICLATALLQPAPPATLIFDEPELGLHPYSLEVLAGLVKQAATRTQVIVSTQSAPLLDYFEPEDVIVVAREDGASVFRRLSDSELAQWLEDYSIGELWQKNVFQGGPVHE